ncbi:AAA domain-containing protein [Lysobacter silvestris]|uniref:AAA domain-containing protein n=1 Tax=Solilutibacter silvestris TaxID=1645665 RepID=A0A2K1PYG7_9GAMM|nr:AAA domain-containing protein [Lysobacter silvestris]
MGLNLTDLFPEDTKRSSAGRGREQFKYHNKAERPPAADVTQEGQPKRRLFTLTRYGEIVRKPTQWLIQGYLVQDTTAGLIAAPGSCKSFMAIDWACRVATGTPWNGRAVKQGAVFYLAGEGHAGLSKRVEGWEIANGVDMKFAPLFISSGMPFLCDSDNIEQTIETIEEAADAVFFQAGVEPALVVIDTVARAMNGANENATEDMGQFVNAMDEIRKRWACTVLSVHHTGLSEGGRARGSSAYAAALDSDFFLTSAGEVVHLKAGEKHKDWSTPRSITLTKVEVETSVIGEDGKQETTLVLHDAAGAVMASALQTQREKALELRARGLSHRIIADTVGASKTTVQRWLKDAA